MFSVDVILRTYFESLRFRRVPCFSHQRGFDWFPVWYNLKDFRKRGIRIRLLNSFQIDYSRLSDTVIVDYRIASDLYNFHKPQDMSRHDLLIEFLEKLRTCTSRLILFETKDSTNIHNELLPYVDLYLKKQLLMDMKLYETKLHGHRLYTHFYSENYDVKEDNFYGYLDKGPGDFVEGLDVYLRHKHKISLAWNIALCHYSMSHNILEGLFFLLKRRQPVLYGPEESRNLRLSANFKAGYESDLIGFQRKQILSGLKERFWDDKRVSYGVVSKKDYIENLISSASVLSPFGWGEICYRDFEAFAAGAALIKPSMDHINTWPNLYLKEVSYLPIPWKIEDAIERICDLVGDDKVLKVIAQRGQELYANLWNKKSMEAFCSRFIRIVRG